MKNLPYIFTAADVVLAAVFAILNRFWSGFEYFVLGLLCLLAIFWGGWLIYKYSTDFKEELGEEFTFFKAEKMNEEHISEEVFNVSLDAYKKEFNKRMFKVKLTKICIILFCFGVAVLFAVGMVLKR